MSKQPKNTGRDQVGRFQKGVSGNPSGRPRGSRNRATRLAEAMLEHEAEELMRQAIDLAKSGDTVALRLCIERLVAKRTERAIQFELPSIREPKDALEAISQIARGVAEGELTAREADALVGLVETMLKAIEVVEIDSRLRALEERIANDKGP